MHPYRDLPDHCFWKRGVGDVAPAELDPIVRAPFQITRRDKVVTAGSCFAQHIGRYLGECGFNFLRTEPPHPIMNAEEAFLYNYGTYTARYGNIYTARQLLQLYKRAYGLFQPEEDLWSGGEGFIDPFRPQIQPGGFRSPEEFIADRAGHLAAVRAAFETLDVFVFTFGLTEGWESTVDGAVFPLCPGVAGGRFDTGRHRLHNFTVAEVVADSLEFIDLLRSVNSSARIILTVSPVPLAATGLAGEHVLTATTYSKSVLRVACAELVEQRERVAYVPSYEIIAGSYARGRYFAADCRSVNEAGVAHVMTVFLRHFAGVDLVPSTTIDDTADAVVGATQDMERLVAVNCEEIMLADANQPPGVPRRLISVCNLCGARDFGPGPGGRLTDDGLNPHCRRCGSLERSRAVASVLQALPRSFLDWRRALLVGHDQGVAKDWFHHGTTMSVREDAPLLDQLLAETAGSFDFVSLIYVLEFEMDDRAVFDALIRLLSPTGIMQICFMGPERRTATTNLTASGGTRAHRRLYGGDLNRHFQCAEKGVSVATVVGVDPHTRAYHHIHFFATDPKSLGVLGLKSGALVVPAG